MRKEVMFKRRKSFAYVMPITLAFPIEG